MHIQKAPQYGASTRQEMKEKNKHITSPSTSTTTLQRRWDSWSAKHAMAVAGLNDVNGRRQGGNHEKANDEKHFLHA